MASARAKIAAATVILLTLSSVEQLTGLLKQVVTAALFGTSEVMDGFLVAIAIVGMIKAWVAHPIDQTIIPMFRHDLVQYGEAKSWANVSILFNNVALGLTLIAFLGWLAAPYLVRVMAPGFEDSTQALATSLTRIAMGSVVFMGVERILSQMLFSYERFSLPGIAGSVENLVEVVVFLILAGTYGIYGMAVAVVLGTVSRFLLQLPILWEKRKFYSPKVDLRHPGMIELEKLSFPLLIASSGDQLARVTDRFFASLLAAGSLSALNFAHGLISALNSLLITSFQQSTFPHFSRLSAEQKFDTLSPQLFHYLRVVFFFTAPMVAGIIIIAEPMVRLLYQRGAFDETSVHLTSQALIVYAFGFPAASMARILNRTFFGLKNTSTPSKLAVFRIVIKIVLSGFLIRPLGYLSIALAESVSQIIRVVLLFFLLPNELKGREMRKSVISFGQTLAAAILMGSLVYVAQEKAEEIFNLPITVTALVLLGVASYGMITLLTQQKELQSLLETAKVLTGKLLQEKSRA
jgi:putative peptidoglycan lipid II flippase